MIKILPLKKEKKEFKPFYRLVVTLGYGEHCDDTFTSAGVEINDKKALKYDAISEEEMSEMSYFEIQELENCITQKEAENIVTFFNSLWEREDKDGYEVTHVVLNDGPSNFWWKDMAAMTDAEFEWFSEFWDRFYGILFNPQIENNWYGITNCEIEYIDKNGDAHKCEVV